jgi:hypothetical protein
LVLCPVKGQENQLMLWFFRFSGYGLQIRTSPGVDMKGQPVQPIRELQGKAATGWHLFIDKFIFNGILDRSEQAMNSLRSVVDWVFLFLLCFMQQNFLISSCRCFVSSDCL